jgi:gliding motility-associated-like protein
MTFSIFAINAQVLNDECRFATPLPLFDNYCSEDGEFTNVGATADPEPMTASCLGVTYTNGVWFSFTPRKPAVLIKLYESGSGPQNTIRDANILIFSDCGSYLNCSKGNTGNTVEFVQTNLTIGKVYYILITSVEGGEGRFRLCVDNIIQPASPESDCNKGVILCSKDPFNVEFVVGTGVVRNEIESGNCLFGNFPNVDPETASTWYRWTCENAGSLTFTLTPNNFINRNIVTTDLDFALYEMPGGIDDCANKKLLRCVAAGEDGGTPLSAWADCNGPTGLREGETDLSERNGCKLNNQNNNGFVAPINMEVGKSYVLIINNFTQNRNGFAIEFGGTGTFLGPKPDFEINANQAFECDKSVVFTNKSTSETDPIINYTWNFGDRAVPDRASGLGPFDVTYQSFGDKIAALTVESSRGCTVTKILDFYVDACCKDTSTLALNAIVVDLKCFEIPEGLILAQGLRGAPEYNYSLDGGPYRPNPQYGNLAAGTYDLAVQDIKGCKDTVEVIINQPPPIIVDAGPDKVIDLGDTTLIQITYTPIKAKDTFLWNPNLTWLGNLDFSGRPFVTTDYTITVVDSNGCVGTDIVQVRVVKNLNLHAPNIFSPNKDNGNDFFNVWASKGVEKIELLEVYDRWGNLVYKGVDGIDFNRNDVNSGWDGTFKEREVNPGVFVWRAGVRWLDGTFGNYAGDVTVYR